MNRHIISFGIALVLCLSLILTGIQMAEPVWADWQDRGDVTSIFQDVPANAWYASYLQEAYNYGIVGGMSANKYGPANNLTHAQIMVMVANLHSDLEQDDFQSRSIPGDHWAASFRDYCKAEGIIDGRFDTLLDTNVTRAEMAYYFARIFEDEFWTNGDEFYEVKDGVAFNDMPKNGYDEYIMKLARADIVGGFADGTFRPGELVTRAQASVFISNILGMNMSYTFWRSSLISHVQTPLPAEYQKFVDFLIKQYPEIQEFIRRNPVDQMTELSWWDWDYDHPKDNLVDIYITHIGGNSAGIALTATFEFNYSANVWELTYIDGLEYLNY